MEHRTAILIRRSAIPAAFVFIHSAAVIGFAMTHPAAAGSNADSAAMTWVFWAIADFPLGFVALLAISVASSNFLAICFVLLIGGIQWMIWGLLLNAALNRIGGRAR